MKANLNIICFSVFGFNILLVEWLGSLSSESHFAYDIFMMGPTFWKTIKQLMPRIMESDWYFTSYVGFISNVPVMLAKPQTFMNASGESVSKLIWKDFIFEVVIQKHLDFCCCLLVFCSLPVVLFVKVGSLVSYFNIPLNQVLLVKNVHFPILF